MDAKAVQKALAGLADPKRAENSRRYFKTGKGEYGEGDQFIGVSVPQQRLVAKQFQTIDFQSLSQLMESPIHEHRLSAIIIAVNQFKRADIDEQTRLYNLYQAWLKRGGINNWDIVDTSAPTIMGGYLYDKSRSPLYILADSHQLWSQRVAIIATLHFITRNDFSDTLAISERLLTHNHDLIHKAIGWMLREVGKQNEKVLTKYLDAHAHEMPRTMLRYAIEKFDAQTRIAYLRS